MNKMISVIIPAYNEEGMIAKTAETISSILTSAAIDHELIFVNDGSKDSTWDKIQEAAGKNPAVRGHLLLAEFWEGSSHVCRDVLRERSLLCGD